MGSVSALVALEPNEESLSAAEVSVELTLEEDDFAVAVISENALSYPLVSASTRMMMRPSAI
jgi:hypothetical protein